MGDAGAASSPDANSIYWNPAKLMFLENKTTFSASFMPWLRALVPDINMFYLSGARKLGNGDQAIGGSLRYVSYGNTSFNPSGAGTGTFKPYDAALDVAYSRKLISHLSMGIVLRVIDSKISNLNGTGTTPTEVVAGAADVSLYYKSKEIKTGNTVTTFSLGVNCSNLGTETAYKSPSSMEPMPTDARIGGGITTEFNSRNSLAVIADINRWLNLGRIEAHSVINYCGGLEYWYNHLLALRAGYFYEPETLRKYFTIGTGVRYKSIGLDLAYLIPNDERNPLQNTMKFTLLFNFNS
jgi:hypothetical protein